MTTSESSGKFVALCALNEPFRKCVKTLQNRPIWKNGVTIYFQGWSFPNIRSLSRQNIFCTSTRANYSNDNHN